MMMQIVGSFAEFERAMFREHTCNGLNAARKEGRIGGRRHKLKVNQQQEIIQLIRSGKKTAAHSQMIFKAIKNFESSGLQPLYRTTGRFRQLIGGQLERFL